MSDTHPVCWSDGDHDYVAEYRGGVQWYVRGWDDARHVCLDRMSVTSPKWATWRQLRHQVRARLRDNPRYWTGLCESQHSGNCSYHGARCAMTTGTP